MSYVDEIDLFTKESRLEKDWNAPAVFIYDKEIVVEIVKTKTWSKKNYYIPFVYNNKKIRLHY